MHNEQPIFNPETHYRIEIEGQDTLEWLSGYYNTTEVVVDEIEHQENITVLDTRTDQTGIVGLVRMLHRLGVNILKIEIIPDESHAAGVQDQGDNPSPRRGEG